MTTLTIRAHAPTLIIAALAMATHALPAQGSAPSQRQFGSSHATFEEAFTLISGVRELADGRVLVSDARDRVVAVLDFRTGEVTKIGREGAGPGEFATPSALYALPGDSTVMYDPANARYFIVTPSAAAGPTFRVPETSPAAFGVLIGVDARGRLLFQRPKPPEGSGPGVASTGIVHLLRFDRATQRTDTLGEMMAPRGENSAARMLSGGMIQLSTNLPLAARDAAVVTTTGDLAILRAAPTYRVEFVRMDGQRHTGPAAVPPRIRVTQAEREAFVRSQVRPGSIVITGGPQPSNAAPGARQTPVFSGDIESLFSPDMTWPDLKPPFIASLVRAGPDGTVWVPRSRAHDDQITVFDVFDRSGRVTMQVSLPADKRLAGFGKGVAYLVSTDEDDLQYLERHPLP